MRAENNGARRAALARTGEGACAHGFYRPHVGLQQRAVHGQPRL